MASRKFSRTAVTGNLYPAWTNLGTRLKRSPLLGGFDQDVLYKDLDGKAAFEKEIEFFGSLLQEYPQRQVLYKGKPLMLIFLGAAQDPNRANNPLWFQIRKFLRNHPEIASKYTFRMMAGYLDAQPDLWATQGTPDGPVEINPGYGFWSWVDRLKTSCTTPSCPYYPSYNETTSGNASRVENFTASIATAGVEAGWGCPNPTSPPYCADDALRFGEDGDYATFRAFMTYARQLRPIFLIIHQFNEYVPPDEGFDANTDDDIEAANLWGRGALHAVRHEIDAYRRSITSEDATDRPQSSTTPERPMKKFAYPVILQPNAFESVVPTGTFEAAQEVLRNKIWHRSNLQVLDALKSLLQKNGRLSSAGPKCWLRALLISTGFPPTSSINLTELLGATLARSFTTPEIRSHLSRSG